MATKTILKHGFKASCERKAVALREAINKESHEMLCAFELAKHLDIDVFSATEFITSADEIEVLKGENNKGNSEWHALTMTTKIGNQIIIHNTFNSDARQQSDVMHELAHIILGHKRVNKDHNVIIPLGLRDFDEVQEEEAKILGGILQLPRECLVWAKTKKMSNQAIADFYKASIEMVKFRLNTSGVNRQFSYRKW